MKTEDFDFVKEKMEKSQLDLPDPLEETEIVSRLEGQRQLSAPKRRIVPLLASAAAMLILIVGIAVAVRFAGGHMQVADQIAASNQAEAQEADAVSADDEVGYKAIADLLAPRMKNENDKSGTYFFAEGAAYGAGTTQVAAEDGVYNSAQGYARDAAAPEEYMYASESASVADNASGEYSALNTRTEGVDETDVYRTDGKYIYILHKSGSVGPTYWFSRYSTAAEFYNGGSQTFSVISANGGAMEALAEKELSLIEPGQKKISRERYFSGFYLYGSYAILTGSETEMLSGSMVYYEDGDYWDYDYETELRIKNRGVVLILDVSDPADIHEVKTLYFDSSILDTRIAGDRLITVSRYYPDPVVFNAKDYTTFIPYCGDAYISAPCITTTENDDGTSFFSVTITDLANEAFPCESASVLGGAYDFYCSGDTVYAYGDISEYVDEKTGWTSYLGLYKIDVGGLKPEYKADARFDNMYFYDDYSIDAYGGYLRLAVQQYDWNSNWNDRNSLVLVLDDNLQTVAQTEPFGEGETIESVRFSGDMAYVVTFYQTDPLFAIDLSDPLHPAITGELKLPGYSGYLHPAGDGYMLGIGAGGTEEGLDGSAKISLFDVSDPENLVETDSIILEDTWIDTDHKKFITRGENGFIVSCWKWNETNEEDNFIILYFTAENGKLQEISRSVVGRHVYLGRALYIGNTLYVYAAWNEYDEENQQYNEYERLIAYDLNSGDQLSELAL